jgi:hypothetical protein
MIDDSSMPAGRGRGYLRNDMTRSPRRGRAALVFLALVMVTVTTAVACGELGDRFPAPPPTGIGGSIGGPAPPCTDGDTRDCHVTLGVQGSVLSCFDGVQTCAGGVWGNCGDGTVRDMPAPPELPQPLLYADAGGCVANPCDPTCQSFGLDAGPDGSPISIPVNPGGATWTGGSLSSLANDPGGLVNKGILANCTSAYDCQFDYKCTNPAIASCVHSKCAQGAALTPGCDPPQSTGPTGCVAEICAKDPACCNAPLTFAGCSVAPCTPAASQPTGCTNPLIATAITTVIGLLGGCGTTWSQACVDKFRQLTGMGCGWDAQCVKEVGTICQITCDKDDNSGVCVPRLANEKEPTCAGVDLTAGIPCDGNIPICNHGQTNLPSQPIRLWFYPANSGHIPAGSPTGSPSPTECIVTKAIPAGKCVNVTECAFSGTNKEIIVNPQNAGLTSPAPIAECTSDNNWTLYSAGTACSTPVCAAGTVATSTTPVNLFVMLDRSGSMGDIPPNPPGNTLTKFQIVKQALTGFFDDPGAAGAHIYFRGFPDASDSSPSGTACVDKNATCDATNLAGEVNACSVPQKIATLPDATLDTYVNNLTNTSFGTPSYIALAGAEKWAKAYKAAHPTEAVAVVYVTDGSPSTGGCSTLAKDASAEAASAFAAGVRTYVIGMYDTNATQTATDFLYLDPIAAAGAGHSTCSSSNPCPSPGACASCKASGQACSTDADCCDGYGACVSSKCSSGTNSACRGLAINASTISAAQLQAQLLAIKQKETSCTMGISACKGAGAACSANADCCSNACSAGACVGGQPGFDAANASLVYTAGTGASVTETYQSSSAGCSGTTNDGWYYDNASAPSTVTLCPKTCSTVKADGNPQIELLLGCPPPYSKTVLTQVYQANCPTGTNPQWSFFSYDTTTPADSNIVFYAQYAGTQAGLCTINTPADLAACTSLSKLATPSAKGGTQTCTTANAATNCPSKVCASNGLCTDPQVCNVSSGFPGCPVDVFAKTGSMVGAAASYLQLVISLNPSTGGIQTPVVNSIGLTYSCPPSD